MKKIICDIPRCGKELDSKNNFGGYFEYRGPNPVTWARGFDLCEEHGQQVLRFVKELREIQEVIV